MYLFKVEQNKTKIGLIPNKKKDINLEYTKKIATYLIDKNFYVSISEHVDIKHKNCKFINDLNLICQECDFLITLGGDGTILKLSQVAPLYKIPIMGINLGTLGYLTDVEKSECFNAIDKVLRNEFLIEKRMMIEGNINNSNYIALNDICALRGNLSKLISVDILVNEKYIDTYRADGIIISSPTGSTAYNLSAGGPILKPDTDLIAITPISPHKISARPIVISKKDTVSIKISDNFYENVIVSVDGENMTKLKKEDILNIYKSKYYTYIIKTNNFSFYDVLRKKLTH